MHLRAQALILGVRQHGEHGAIVRAMTREAGMLAGYVRGGRSRANRPVLQPANSVIGEAGWPASLAGRAQTGTAIEAHLLTDRRAEALAARARLVDRLKRVVA